MALDIIGSTIMFSIIGMGLFFILTLILNFVTKGFIYKYLRAKASRGKLVLTEVESQTDNYYALGEFVDGTFKYETRGGIRKRLTKVTKKHVKSLMGVFVVKVNETTDFAYLQDGAFPEDKDLPDAAATDNIINRILLAAGLNDPRLMYILIGVVLLLIFAIVIIFLEQQAITAAKACQTLTATIR